MLNSTTTTSIKENFEIIKKNKEDKKSLISSGVFAINIDENIEFKIEDLTLEISFNNEKKEIEQIEANNKKVKLLFPYPPELGKRSLVKEISYGTIKNRKISYYLAWEFTNKNKKMIFVYYSFFEKTEMKESLDEETSENI